MAKLDIGKAWEECFNKDWKKCFPNTLVFRLKDQMTGYKETSENPCDFLCFPGNNHVYMCECKAHKGISIPFGVIPQYERLLDYKDLNNVIAGVIVWFYERDSVIWVDIHNMEKMVKNGEKSIGLRMLEQKDKDGNLLYNIIKIPFEKKRVYVSCDYTILTEEKDDR